MIDWKKATFETISYFQYCKQEPSIPTKNIHILEALAYTQNPKIKEITLKAREVFATGNETLYKSIKTKLPCVTFSGGFVTTKPRKKENGAPTHTLVLDIDHISTMGKTTDEVKQILFAYPSVYWVQLSCSGDGVFALVYMNDKNKREEYFNWFEKDLIENHGIKLDKLDDITRLRFICWDENPLAKDEIVPCVNTYVPQVKKRQNRIPSIYEKLYDEMHDKQYVMKETTVEHLSHPDRMKLFNSLRCVFKNKEKVMEEWNKCMNMMSYGPQYNTNLYSALEEPYKNNWFDYSDPKISYKLLSKFYSINYIQKI